MPWVKVDDHFDEHPKMAAVGPVGWGVWLAGLAYCNRNLTDGFIPYSIAEGIGGSWEIREPIQDELEAENGPRTVRNRQRVWSVDIGSGMHGESITTAWVIAQLVRVALWTEVTGGYLVHDYEQYQPTKAAVLAERRAWADKKKSRRDSTRESMVESQGDSSPSPNRPVPVPVPVPSPVLLTGTKRARNTPMERVSDVLKRAQGL